MSSTQTTNNDRLRAAAQGQQVATKTPQSFPQMLQAYKVQIAAALPKHADADRMARIALTCYRQNPALAECDPASIFAAVIQSSQLGLELGMLGHAYLIPYRDKKRGMIAQFIPGWRGLVDLVNRAGRASVRTGAVYEGDDFEFQFGTTQYLNHKPAGNDDVGKLTHVYAIGHVKGSDSDVIEVWPVSKVLRHRNQYNRQGDRHYSMRDNNNFEMYARKIALLQVLKYLPMSSEQLVSAMTISEREEGASPVVVDLVSAIKGDALIPEMPPEDAEDAVTPLPDDFEALSLTSIKQVETPEALEKLYDNIHKQYAAANTDVPLNLEAAWRDRRETLTTKAKK